MTTGVDSNHGKPAILEDGHDEQRSIEPKQTAIEQKPKDNVVDWDGPDDSQNPRNWPTWKRMTQVILASAFLLTA